MFPGFFSSLTMYCHPASPLLTCPFNSSELIIVTRLLPGLHCLLHFGGLLEFGHPHLEELERTTTTKRSKLPSTWKSQQRLDGERTVGNRLLRLQEKFFPVFCSCATTRCHKHFQSSIKSPIQVVIRPDPA